MTGHGPYDTFEQADADAAALYAAIKAAGPGGQATDETLARRRAAIITHIANALHQAGVVLGERDSETVAWLSMWEPETIEVILGWVARARAAADNELRADIETLRVQVTALETALGKHQAPMPFDIAAALAVAERRARR